MSRFHVILCEMKFVVINRADFNFRALCRLCLACDLLYVAVCFLVLNPFKSMVCFCVWVFIIKKLCLHILIDGLFFHSVLFCAALRAQHLCPILSLSVIVLSRYCWNRCGCRNSGDKRFLALKRSCYRVSFDSLSETHPTHNLLTAP